MAALAVVSAMAWSRPAPAGAPADSPFGLSGLGLLWVLASGRDLERRSKRVSKSGAGLRAELFCRLPSPSFLCSLKDGRFLECNRSFLEWTGYARDELLGRRAGEIGLWPPGALLRQLESSVPAEIQPIRLRSGAVRDCRLRLEPIELGGEPHVLGSLQDAALPEAEPEGAAEWLRAMDFFEDAVCLLDLDDKVQRANRAFFALTGFDPKRVVGRRIGELMHPNGERLPCPVCAARQERRDAHFLMEKGHPDNLMGRPVEVMVRVIRDPAGTPSGMLIGVRDLTRLRQAERELLRLNDHIHLLLDSTGEGVYGLTSDGLCTFVNRSALEMLGYTREELIGKSMHDIIHHRRPDGSPFPAAACPIYRACREGKAYRAEDDSFWRKDGSALPVEQSLHPVMEDGRAKGAVVVFRDVSESRALARKMDYLATHDALTGLANRHEFEIRLQRALHSARGYGAEHVLFYMDLDQFKVINDTCGHAAGDELLRRLGALLHARLGRDDTLARLGGDEFGVLLESCTLEDAMALAYALRETVQDFRFAWQDKTFALGVSIGVYPVTGDTESPASALSTADTACYLAKEGGRNRIHVYQPDDAEIAQRHGEMQWVSRIHEALAGERLALMRQAIVPLDPGNAPGERYEMLIRMRDAQGNWVSPGAFLPAAERFGLMPAIDRWVVGSTLAWLARHREQAARLVLCTINLSGNTLGDDSFLDFVVDRLRRSEGVAPHQICFEITETAAIANLGRATVFMQALKELGCCFALDDFGSGMSSFGYLKNLPVDFLKIDGNFVRDICADAVDRAIVEAINQVGQVMGLQTIAEYVENAQVLEALRAVGVNYAQGYAVGRPQPLEPAP